MYLTVGCTLAAISILFAIIGAPDVGAILAVLTVIWAVRRRVPVREQAYSSRIVS